jgi:replicative DNA helicase
MLDKTLIGAMPTCVEYEKLLLGSLLMDSDLFLKASDKLEASDFALPEHKILFRTMFEMYGHCKHFSDNTILEQLRIKGNLEKAGGPLKIAQLQEMFAPRETLTDIITMIKKTSQSRYTIEESIELIQLCKNIGDGQLEEKVQSLVSRLTKSRLNAAENSFVILKEAIQQTFTSINVQKDQVTSTSFPSLDKITNGFRNKDLIIMGARPSMGKTALVVTMIKNLLENGRSIGFISAEMSIENITTRLLVQETGLRYQDIVTCNLSSDGYENLTKVITKIEDKPLYIDDKTYNIYDIKKRAMYLKETANIDILFVDYLQRLSAGGKKDNMEIAFISSELKTLAKELNIPVVALSQLNRGVESRPDKHPTLSDLRDSGSIEQDADIVALLYRDEYYNPETQDKGILEIDVAKNRNGALGKTKLFFEGNTMSFKEIEWVDSKGQPHSSVNYAERD